MQCEMCGREEKLFLALIEGSELNVCAECAKYGKIIGPIETQGEPRKKQSATQQKSEVEEKEIILSLVDSYPEIIKNAREKKGLSQEQLAKALAQKESLVHNIESGRFQPPIDLARKFEKYLKVKLVEQLQDNREQAEAARRSGMLTIGDMLTMKKSKS